VFTSSAIPGDRDHSGLLKQGLHAGTWHGSSCGVRGSGSTAPGRASSDNRKHRLVLAEVSCQPRKFQRIAEGLQIESTNVHGGVVGPGGEEVVPGHIRLVSQRHEVADPDAGVFGRVEQSDSDAA
jgi:hypothetical protein